MAQQINIPQPVKDSIRKHIDKSVAESILAYPSAFEDEDVLTGVLFGRLKIGSQKVDMPDRGTWQWSIDFKKFGGRGPGATESILGADGIFDLEVNYGRNETVRKSLLFQSKIDWKKKDEKLYKQCGKMLTWLGAATIINYTETEFEAFGLETVIANQGSKPVVKRSLENLLGEDFLDCKIGDLSLEYDAVKKQLQWRDINNDIVATKFTLRRRLSIKIVAPDNPYRIKIDKFINSSDLHKHRIKNDLVYDKLIDATSIFEAKKVRNKLSTSLHPDKHASLPAPQVEMLDDIMKSVNTLFKKREKELRPRTDK